MTVDQLNTLDASDTNWNFSLNEVTSSASLIQNASELFSTIAEPIFGGGGNGSMVDENIFGSTAKSIVYPQCLWGDENWNCTEEQYLVYGRGPRTLPLSTALSVSIIL